MIVMDSMFLQSDAATAPTIEGAVANRRSRGRRTEKQSARPLPVDPLCASPFERAITSAERAMLAPALARQYLGREVVTLTGTTRVWRRRRWLSPLFRLLAPMHILFAETGDEVPTTLQITTERDRAGRATQRWERVFSFAGVDRRFDGLVAWDDRLGQVVERIGPGRRLDSPFRLQVRPDGLRITARRLRLTVAGHAVRLPRLLGPSALVDHQVDANDPDLIQISVVIAHPLLGPLFGYEGAMRISDGESSLLAETPSMLDRVLELAPKHPVGMTTAYRTVAILNYAVEPDVLRRLIPPALELDTAHDRGYVTVVCADMVKMRPSPLPHVLGITYDQVVYRVPVRYHGEPGLFFLGSDAGQPLMVAAGAAFSMFGVRLSKTKITDAGDRVSIDVFGRKPGVDFHAYLKVEPAAEALPTTSTFESKAEAKSFLVDRFVAFVPGVGNDPMRRVRVRRGIWDVVLPSAIDVRSDILDGSSDFPAGTALLDNVLVARDIPYHWYAAEIERSPGQWRRPRLSLPD